VRRQGPAFTIARGEALAAFAALEGDSVVTLGTVRGRLATEVAAIVGDAETAGVERCLLLTHRLYALLSGLIR
jgi:hypothetical protein